MRLSRLLASTILYWRGHIKRMPVRLLLPHLAKKSVRTMTDSFNNAFGKEEEVATP